MTYRSHARAVRSVLLVILLAVLGAGALLSSHPAAAAGAPRLIADANKRFSVSGIVRSVSYVSNSMRVTANGQSVEISITPTTAIEVHGETGSISDIRRGAKISASGVIRDGVWIANSIVIH